MTSMPPWDSPISGFSHCFIVVSSLVKVECRFRELSGAIFFDGRTVQFTFPSSSTPRFTCCLTGSIAAAAILVASARTSSAWDVSVPNSFCQ